MYGNGNTFDFIDPSQSVVQQPQYQPTVQMFNQAPIHPPVDNEIKITGGGTKFTIIENETPVRNKMSITVDSDITPAEKKKSSKVKKESNENLPSAFNNNEIIKAEVVEDVPTINTYFETATMIKQSMDQLDNVICDIKRELDDVRSSRTMKSKYNVMVGLAGNLSDLMTTRINAIKELNNCISKSNDMDYKRQKDRKDAMAGAGSGDEIAVMQLYKNMVADPSITLGQVGQRIPDYVIQQMQHQMNSNTSDGIIRAGASTTPMPSFDPTQDTGYINYMANMPASMNALLMEQNPDIKEVVVFDASTGAKWFQVMNTKTNQVIPNMQVTDQMFMEDTTLNIKNRTAQNINLGKVYPLIIINDNVTSQY